MSQILLLSLHKMLNFFTHTIFVTLNDKYLPYLRGVFALYEKE
jgi:hypothetical protein